MFAEPLAFKIHLFTSVLAVGTLSGCYYYDAPVVSLGCSITGVQFYRKPGLNFPSARNARVTARLKNLSNKTTTRVFLVYQYLNDPVAVRKKINAERAARHEQPKNFGRAAGPPFYGEGGADWIPVTLKPGEIKTIKTTATLNNMYIEGYPPKSWNCITRATDFSDGTQSRAPVPL